MRKVIIFIIPFFITLNVSAQMLLENKEGDSQFLPFIQADTVGIGLIKLNTGDQSIGFDYFKVISPDKAKYKFWSLGFKAKPTEGYAEVFNNNQFTPGITINGAYSKVKIFDPEETKPENNFIDWGAIYFKYSKNKYQLFNEDTTYNNQFYTKEFDGLGVGVNYNVLLKSTYQISLSIGYERRNNFSDLKKIEVKDIKTFYDSTTNVTREVSSSKTVHQGNFNEFDTYPIGLSFTKLTSDDPNIKSYQFGYNLYVNTQIKKSEKAIIKAGCIIFLAKNKKA